MYNGKEIMADSFSDREEGQGKKRHAERCGKGATAGSINCCDYFKISGGVYAAVRGECRAKRVQPTRSSPLFSFVSRFFLFSLFISFRSPPPPRPSSRPPRTYKPERAHKLSLLRACHALLNSGLPTDTREECRSTRPTVLVMSMTVQKLR